MRWFTRFSPLLVAFVLLAASCAAPAPQPEATDEAAAAPLSQEQLVARGQYLVTIQDCNGCHTPFGPTGEPDMSRMLSGHPQDIPIAGPPTIATEGWATAISNTNTAWSTPAGVAFTSNLTPDRATGIGSWTTETFIAAIRNGRKSGAGAELLPPMPWRMYAQASDEDLAAIFAYLQTIPAISNQVPESMPAPAPDSQ